MIDRPADSVRRKVNLPLLLASLLLAAASASALLLFSGAERPRPERDRLAGLTRGGYAAGGQGPGTIEGLVLDPRGRVVAGARVLAVDQPLKGGLVLRAVEAPPASDVPLFAVSDARGRFVLAGLKPGGHVVTATARGHGTAVEPSISVGPGEVLSNVELRLSGEGALLSGRTMDAGGGFVAGARVRARRAEVEAGGADSVIFEDASDEQGAYELRLAPGRYLLAVAADGYAPSDDLLDVNGPEVRDIRLQPAARLAGRVITADGDPVSEAEVRIEALEPSTLAFARAVTATDTGEFMVTGLMAGAYRVVARKDELVGSSAMAIRLAVGALREVVIQVGPGARLEASIEDLRGKAIANAVVWVVQDDLARGQTPGQRQSRSDAAGKARIPGLLTGSYRLRAQAEGFASKEQGLILAKPGPSQVEVVLSDEAKVVGEVRAEDGAPVANVLVQGRVKSRTGGPLLSSQTKTDQGGKFTLRGLGAGGLHVSARGERGIVQTARAELEVGETKRIDLRLETGARLSGTVSWDDGQPAANVLVVAQSRTTAIGHVLEVRTDAKGLFTVGPLPAGDVSVHAASPRQRQSPLWPRDSKQLDLVLARGEHNAAIKLILARRDQVLSGIVLGPDGQPVPDAVVRAAKDQGGFPQVERSPSSTVTAPDGTFKLEELAQGTYAVTASHPQYAEVLERGVATGGPSVRLRFAPPASLAGVVVLAAGRPVTSFSLFVSGGEPASPQPPGQGPSPPPGAAGRIPEEIRSPAGEFEVGGLRPGRYKLRVLAVDGSSAELENVDLTAGEKRRGLRLVVKRGRSVAVDVRDFESGAGIGGAVAEVRLPGGVRLRAVADDRGRVVVENVPRLPGLTVMVRAPRDGHEPEVRAIPDRDEDAVALGVVQLVKDRPRTEGQAMAQVSFLPSGERLVVTRLTPASPATAAGFRPGDEVLAIDGRDARGMGVNGIMTLLAGPPNSEVKFLVQSPGQPARELRMPRVAMR